MRPKPCQASALQNSRRFSLEFFSSLLENQKAQRSRKEQRRKELAAIFASAFAPFAFN